MLIVDGYNVIGRNPILREKKSTSLERARIALANMVFTWNQRHDSYDCLIVFDGRDPIGSNSSKVIVSGVRCLFTKTKIEADDEIIRAVRESLGVASNITVVSDDNYVGNNCRAHGATVEPASYFDKSQNKGSANRSASGEKTMDQKSISEINKEQRIRFGL